MTIWTFKTTAAALGLLTLAACGDVVDLPVLGGLTQPDDAAVPPVALSQTQMANKAFTLVPPQGFCIDKSSLKQRFALMARCDTLGAPDVAGGAALGILTVSVTPEGRADTLPTPRQTADALKLARVSAPSVAPDSVTFRAEGVPPVADLDASHWRGTLRINGQLVGLALFGPKGGRATSDEGREILNALISRSREASTPSG
jgi:hypothetical protein